MTIKDVRNALQGGAVAAAKEEQQLAAKRERDRKRYALKTNQPWRTNAPDRDNRHRDLLQQGVQS